MTELEQLKQKIFESDNRACFLERERILERLEVDTKEYQEPDRFAIILSKLLAEVSTPIHECDYFAGRVIEGISDREDFSCNNLLGSEAHMHYDYAKLLNRGLKGILEDIQFRANNLCDDESKMFAHNCEIIILAIRDYAMRYADEAEKNGKDEMAKALRRVPYEAAYDFYSALQSVWLIHMIASCYVGGRDYGFGRFDIYMLPFYQKAIKEGQSIQDITELLAGFFVKTNEICGRTAHDYLLKPIPSVSSKQYVNIGGEHVNEFSTIVLDAAMLVNMPQPQFTVLLKPEVDEKFTKKVFKALEVLTDKIQIYNYNLVVEHLKKLGLEEEIAKEVTYSGCCTMDLHYHTMRREHYVPFPQIFIEVLNKGNYRSVSEIVFALKTELEKYMDNVMEQLQMSYPIEKARKQFGLDAILLADSSFRCRYFSDGNSKYNIINVFCPGIATVGDSLMVLDKIIFTEKRYTYQEFLHILKENYENNESVLQHILKLVPFGNDSENDKYTVLAANSFLDVIERIKTRDNFYIVSGFYSLNRDNRWRSDVSATPNGRRCGEPISENQSPTYGADKKGVTATLKSLSKLPFNRAVAGGLNVTFSGKISAEILQALVLGYFESGGLHVGISVIDRFVLEDAMAHPEKHQNLTVRVYGFSEYFTSLDKLRQRSILDRTEYQI